MDAHHWRAGGVNWSCSIRNLPAAAAPGQSSGSSSAGRSGSSKGNRRHWCTSSTRAAAASGADWGVSGTESMNSPYPAATRWKVPRASRELDTVADVADLGPEDHGALDVELHQQPSGLALTIGPRREPQPLADGAEAGPAEADFEPVAETALSFGNADHGQQPLPVPFGPLPPEPVDALCARCEQRVGPWRESPASTPPEPVALEPALLPESGDGLPGSLGLDIEELEYLDQTLGPHLAAVGCHQFAQHRDEQTTRARSGHRAVATSSEDRREHGIGGCPGDPIMFYRLLVFGD